MLDIHVHVLPGIDDGPASLDDSLELVRIAAADGIRTIAATPHLREDHPGVVPGELAGRCEEVNARLADEGLDVRIVPAGELDVAWATQASDEELLLTSYCQDGAYLLLETPYGHLPPHFEQLVFELQLRGYGVLLAHPERNPSFQGDPDRLEALVARGILVQVTAVSLASRDRRSKTRQLSARLVERGLAHVIASDSHGAGAFGRVRLSEGVAAAARIDPARAEWMVNDVPAAILRGEKPPTPPPPQRAQRRLLPLGGGRARRA